MNKSGFKTELFEQFARIGKALSSGNRLEMLEFLAQGERNVEALAQVCRLTVANTSRHLQLLRQAGLVSARKQGQQVYYCLNSDDVVEILDILRRVAERHLTEVDHLVRLYLTVKDALEPIPARELLQRVQKGLVTVLDVRPVEEYSAGHVAGAINIPLERLKEHLAHLPTEREVIAYCRGPHCILAYDAVAELRKQGLQARRLEFGYPEWKLAGLPTEQTTIE